MTERTTGRITLRSGWTMVLGGIALALSTPSCASHAVRSGAAVGAVGRGLSTHAWAVPQGAEACAMGDALAASAPGAADKPVSDTCAKALNSDLLWRRTMIVLSAYSAKLEAGEGPGKEIAAGRSRP